MLQLGQIVRYKNTLWRVDFVNDCRAKIVPLEKRHIIILDDEGNLMRAFDSARRGVNISPNSVLPIVQDAQRAADEIELVEAEREAAEARAALAREATQVSLEQSAMPARGDWKPIGAAVAKAPPAGWRWSRIAGINPDCDPDSLKYACLILIEARPGMTTRELAALLSDEFSSGAVAVCLDRFHKVGILKRSSGK